MYRYVGLLLVAVLLLPLFYAAPLSRALVDNKVVVAVDLAHGESDKYLNYIMGNITWVEWKIIEPGTTITFDVLADVDILLIGQPTSGFSPDEMLAIRDWFYSGNKVLWVAGDSDYGGGPSTISACNDLLEFLGAKLRIEQAAVYDDIHNAQRFYRVLTRVKPDYYPPLYTHIISENITKPVLMHGPSAVIWVDETGTYHDPVSETFPGLIRIIWSYDTAYIGDNNPPAPYLYNPLIDINRSFVMVAAEYQFEYNSLLVASGESPYGDYEPMYSWEYYGVELDGPQFIKNMIRWFTKIVTEGPAGPTKPITVAVDLAHGESDKYLNYIMGNITWVEWKIIEPGTTITFDVLADVDVLILGQPTSGFSPDEMLAIKEWLESGNKIIWVAGDSDYGGGPSTISACNDLLEFIGSRLRIEQAAVYDDIHNAQRFYRVLTRVMPDNIPELFTHMISEGITKPVLMHGPSAVIWVDENGVYHDPVSETFLGLIRIVWSYDTAYIGDNNPPAPYLYNPLVDINRSFVMVAAEYRIDKNVLIVASGESPYGDYEPMYSWEYYGVELDGPRFIANMITWFGKLIEARYVTPTPTLTTVTETVTETVTTTTTSPVTTTVTTTSTSTVTTTVTTTRATTITTTVTTTSPVTLTAPAPGVSGSLIAVIVIIIIVIIVIIAWLLKRK